MASDTAINRPRLWREKRVPPEAQVGWVALKPEPGARKGELQ